MSIYGEGLYSCGGCGTFAPKLRPAEQLAARDWEVHCPLCGTPAESIPVPESKPLYPTSIYAINKRDHEEMFLATGEAYGIPVTAMRFFNVYGTRQALSNPYTGVGAIFASRLLNSNPPVIFEDGLQSRDFIHVSDLVRACSMALENSEADGRVFNLGTGRPTSVLDIGIAIADRLGKPSDNFLIRNEFRAGDIRHCFADTGSAQEILGFSASVDFADGVDDLCDWVASCTSSDMVDRATAELRKHGLAR